MAKTKEVAKTESAKEVKAPLNEKLLAKIVEGTKSEQGYAFVGSLESIQLVEAGLVVVNESIQNEEGDIAAKLTDEGFKHIGEDAPKPNNSAAEVSDVVNSAQAKENLVKAPPKPRAEVSQVVPFELPEARKRGGARPEQYPFSKLKVGEAFFIPATKEVPNPATAYASTVASARGRYSHPHPTETKKNRAGETVPVMVPYRDFQIRAINDGAAFGEQYAGKPGAVVGRTL